MIFNGRITYAGDEPDALTVELAMRAFEQTAQLKESAGLPRLEKTYVLSTDGLTVRVNLMEHVQQIHIINPVGGEGAPVRQLRKELYEEVSYELVIKRTQDTSNGDTYDGFAKFVFQQETLHFVWEEPIVYGEHEIRSPLVDFLTNRAYGIYHDYSAGQSEVYYTTPVNTIVGGAGFGIGQPTGFSSTGISAWPYVTSMDLVGAFEFRGEFYWVALGFLSNQDPLSRTRVEKLNEDGTRTLLHEKFWPGDYLGGFPHRVQFDSERGVLYMLLNFSGWLVLASYDVVNNVWQDRVLSGGSPTAIAIGFDPREDTLIAAVGISGGSAFGYDYTLHFIDPVTLTSTTSDILNDPALLPHPDDWNPTVSGIAPLFDRRYIVVTYYSTQPNFTEFGKSVQQTFAVLRRLPESDTSYEVIELVKRPDVQPDHPANDGLDPSFSFEDVFVNPLVEEYEK